MRLTVVVPAHNPDPGRLARTLEGLRRQTLPSEFWETLLVDNASAPALAAPAGVRLVREERLGLTAARLRGFAEAQGALIVLVDDDNVLAPDYLAQADAAFAADPGLGAAGGKSQPEFARPPAPWTREFDGLLALRDLGESPIRADWSAAVPRQYPPSAPIGAGLVLRRAAAQAYAEALARDPGRRAFDRTGARLVSGGDNDLIMTVLEAGYALAYRPELRLTHLIPPERSERAYLGALNRAIARSWVGVLAVHGIRPWPPVRRGLRARQARAWLRTGAWRGPAAWVRWQGRCGTFEGQADLAAFPSGAGPARRYPRTGDSGHSPGPPRFP
jgi:glycosyltransferase involved in cell wall biosynthesis